MITKTPLERQLKINGKYVYWRVLTFLFSTQKWLPQTVIEMGQLIYHIKSLFSRDSSVSKKTLSVDVNRNEHLIFSRNLE